MYFKLFWCTYVDSGYVTSSSVDSKWTSPGILDNPDWNVGVIDCQIRWHDPSLRGFEEER